MKPFFRKIVRASIAVGLGLMAGTDASAQNDTEGIIRISKPKTVVPAVQQATMWCNMSGRQPGMYYHDQTGDAMCNYFRCKFGYFIPSGAGGAGIPVVGKYSRVYPQDPHYFDQRDGQTWAAQGYGAPIAVPLAPVVGHSFNYGAGIPSSRLTPVSRPAY